MNIQMRYLAREIPRKKSIMRLEYLVKNRLIIKMD